MLRGSSVVAGIALVVSLSLIAVGCGSSGKSEADDLAAPLLGACRALSVDDLSAPSNSSAVLDCTEPHTAQTFAVGVLPDSTGPGYDESGHGRFVFDTCQKALGDFLGADESTLARSQVSWSWFRASKSGWDRGARWYRCDVVGGPADATQLRPLPTDAKGLFSNAYPDAWMTCALGEVPDPTNKVPCDTAHDWRAVTTVKVGEPGASYPGDRIVEVRSRDFCRDSVRGWLGYPPDFDFSYTWFRQDRWEGGNRRSICWARTTK